MMKLETLKKLYVEELKDLYSVEKQLIEALNKMAGAANSPDLKTAFQDHLRQSKEHKARIERIFEDMDYSPGGKHCEGIEGIISEGEEHINDSDIDPDVLDAALIASAQKAEHYEMAGYGTVRTYAQTLGYREAADLLQRTLDEEADTDEKLTRLAEGHINVEAVA